MRNLLPFRRKDPKAMLGLFITGSLVILLLCLCASAAIFSVTFLKKEEQRATISTKQLSSSFSFNYRAMAEEMWTKNYDAIAKRVNDIAKQFGHASFDVVLTDENKKCLFTANQENSSRTCQIPKNVEAELEHLNKGSELNGVLRFDEASNRYVYTVPLAVGAIRKGYLFASVDDPYEFYRGNAVLICARIFLPAILLILMAWVGWLLASRRFFLRPYLSSLVELEKNEALGKLAAQIAHDIRSPLTALKSVVQGSKGLLTDENQLLKSAASRIESLADDLLSRYKNTNSGDDMNFTLVSAVVNSMISEKIAILGERCPVEIKTEIAANALTAGVPISGTTLSRVLSNLINNAVDAIKPMKHGLITTRVDVNESVVHITVEDTGHGMSPEVLHKVRTIGGSYGKDHAPGHELHAGLGLQFAKEVAIRAGGSLSIESTLNEGTRITLIVPVATTPSWCATEISFQSGKHVLVMDDDPSVHLLWQQRLAGRRVIYLKDPEEFDVSLYPPSKYQYILDHEVRESAVTGLDLIVTNKLGDSAILATSYFNDPKIQAAISKAGAKMLPKFLISGVQIRTTGEPIFERGADASSGSVRLIQVDDEQSIRSAWSGEAKRKNVGLLQFDAEPSIEILRTLNVQPTTEFYLDLNLGKGKSGFDVARKLYNAGYRNLFISTGYERASVEAQAPEFLKGRIRGKEFPVALA